ncbi:MAG: bifunctional proline dehydrogenase/L-glutamate gamma-semialdehyde dehydrogenase PutA [Novosphingobium sp.]
MSPDLTRWDRLDRTKYRDEAEAVAEILALEPLATADRKQVEREAAQLVVGARAHAGRQRLMEGFLAEYSLDTAEGLALMGLAEALLRTPDAETRDALIAERILAGDWAAHAGKSDNLLVEAATRGLVLSRSLLSGDADEAEIKGAVHRLAKRMGEPVIRRAVATAVGIMGNQFVLGRTIEEGLDRAGKENTLCSFDMLGEGARTYADAERYERIYAEAIAKVGKARGSASPEEGHGISVKLSALHPRYSAVQEASVWEVLYPRLKRLAVAAAAHNLNMAIDAEEADRLVISLKLVERLAFEAELGDWTGLGVVVQAYQKRAMPVLDGLADLARRSGRRIMVRLVKGAYWDSEIKRAQVAGRPGYPVFTTKAATDVNYLACARRLIAASPLLYPQFATHNAHSLAAVRLMARQAGVIIEHQRLHGMGEALYAAAGDDIRLRAYAPIGGHDELLPYLVRRLLENGANSSFVHDLLDDEVPPETLVADPVAKLAAAPGPHPRIPLPADLYGPARRNSDGLDLSIAETRESLSRAIAALDARYPDAPADASEEDIHRLAAHARLSQPEWNARGGAGRAPVLRAMADALQAHIEPLTALLAREAGKTLEDGIAEVREAVDFCRYYAGLAEAQFNGLQPLPGPVGETNALELRGRGTFACISPWNFPLAIFTGQIAAALAAGNAVLAKPAEQTPRIAAEAVRLFRAAGLPEAVLALVPGDGASVGAALVAHPGIDGVAFTGGTETAWAINRSLASREGPIVPFIAETGGLNGMFADTTALKEQLVDDAVLSAFGSAGQRCSALRMLYLPEESADAVIETIIGAMDALVLGDPADPSSDVGPVIDADAKAALEHHLARLRKSAEILHGLKAPEGAGLHFGPVLAEVPEPDFLQKEVFGPILHIYRYKADELEEVAHRLAARGYGLTLGVHSRLESFANRIRALVPAGNMYVNRSIIGAVVGVQPFGGEGLSGTGPKAGGPHALLRFANERALSVNIAAQGGDPALLGL